MKWGEGEEEVYMWPQSTETPEEDLIYHKQCPLSCKLKIYLFMKKMLN